jgi:hypothetical protein
MSNSRFSRGNITLLGEQGEYRKHPTEIILWAVVWEHERPNPNDPAEAIEWLPSGRKPEVVPLRPNAKRMCNGVTIQTALQTQSVQLIWPDEIDESGVMTKKANMRLLVTPHDREELPFRRVLRTLKNTDFTFIRSYGVCVFDDPELANQFKHWLSRRKKR